MSTALQTYLTMTAALLRHEIGHRNIGRTTDQRIDPTGSKAELVARLFEDDATPVRASALLDMPADLDDDERRAYIRSYSDACLRYARKHGTPSIAAAGVTARIRTGNPSLHQITVEYEWARHPEAHRSGLLTVKKRRAEIGERLRVESQRRMGRVA